LVYLAEEPFFLKEINNKDPFSVLPDSREELLHILRLDQRPKAPIAFLPPKNFPRMVSQRSAFTIHPNPGIEPDAKQIADFLTSETSLVRYIIPPECKRSLQKDLFALGISRGTLFQDLDSLCDDVVNSARDISRYNARDLPDPPKCSGEMPDIEQAVHF
jgi:hypothetical protein